MVVESEEGSWLIPLGSSWQRRDVTEDDCVIVLFPLGNQVRMNGNGRALMEPHPDNKILVCTVPKTLRPQGHGGR